MLKNDYFLYGEGMVNKMGGIYGAVNCRIYMQSEKGHNE